MNAGDPRTWPALRLALMTAPIGPTLDVIVCCCFRWVLEGGKLKGRIQNNPANGSLPERVAHSRRSTQVASLLRLYVG